MSDAGGLKVDGPFYDRAGVIVPVSPGRALALGNATGTYGGRVRLAVGDDINCDDGTSAELVFRTETFGAVADYDTVTDATCTATSVVVSSPSNPWSATDVGKLVRVRYGGAAGAQLLTTIAAVNSPGSIDLAAAAGSSIVGTATVEWGTDNRAALQACLDAAIATQGTVFVGRGEFLVSGPLFIGAGSMAPRVRIVGRDSFGIRGQGSTLRSFALDLPILIVQGSRGVYLERIALHGPAYEIDDKISAGGFNALVEDATFTMAGLRSDDYSPNCCIAVDPFDPTVPAGSRYPGLGAYYVVSLKSTRITISHCGLRWAHTLVAWCCNGFSGNGENSVIEQSELNVGVVGFHVTADQTNNVQLIGNSYTQMKYAICTMDLATWVRVGMPPRITHASFGWCRYLFVNGDRSLYVSKAQAEAFHAIGVFKGSNFNGPDLIESSEFGLNRATAAPNVDFDIWASKLVNFKSCTFSIYDTDGVPVRLSGIDNPVSASFDDCLFVSSTVTDRSSLLATTLTFSVPLKNCRMSWATGAKRFWNGEANPRSIEVAYSTPLTYLGGNRASFTGLAGTLASMAVGDPVHVGAGGALWTIPVSEVPTDGGTVNGFVGTVESIVGTTVTLRGLGKAAIAAADGLTNRRLYWTRSACVPAHNRAQFLDVSSYPEVVTGTLTVLGYHTALRTSDAAGGVAVQLPDPRAHARRVVEVIANRLSTDRQLAAPTTVTAPGYTINRAASVVLNWNHQSMRFYSDGTEWWTLGHVRELEELVGSFTVAQLLAGTPSPSPAGKIVYCSDHFGGAREAYSDGATWRDTRTGLVVS